MLGEQPAVSCHGYIAGCSPATSQPWQVGDPAVLMVAQHIVVHGNKWAEGVVQERSTSSSQQWRQAIQDVDEGILAYLRTNVAGGFDEAQFGDRIGFASLKR